MFEKNFKKEKPKIVKDDCEIEVRQTNKGRKIRFKGKCTREQIEIAKLQNGVEE